MARQCSVCTHRDRDTIDKALVEHNVSYRHLASKSGVSLSAIYRHAKNHIPESLATAEHAKDVVSADKLLDRIGTLISQSEELLEYGRSKGKTQAWKGGLEELHKNTLLLAKVTGELSEQPQINIVTNPQWIHLRTDLIQILSNFPEARKKVIEAFNANSDPRD